MKYIYIILFSIIVFYGCSTVNTSGTRAQRVSDAIKGGYFEWKSTEGFLRLKMLKLNENGTFDYYNDLVNFKGDWKVSPDGKYLYVEGKSYKSFFQHTLYINHKFKIKKDKLVLMEDNLLFIRKEEPYSPITSQ